MDTVAHVPVEFDLLLLRQTIKDALNMAANAGRVLVLPELSCTSPWITANDPKVMWLRRPGEVTRCFVGSHSYEFCWAWDYVAYAFDPLVVPRFVTAKKVFSPNEDVIVLLLNGQTNTSAEKECRDFYLSSST